MDEHSHEYNAGDDTDEAVQQEEHLSMTAKELRC